VAFYSTYISRATTQRSAIRQKPVSLSGRTLAGSSSESIHASADRAPPCSLSQASPPNITTTTSIQSHPAPLDNPRPLRPPRSSSTRLWFENPLAGTTTQDSRRDPKRRNAGVLNRLHNRSTRAQPTQAPSSHPVPGLALLPSRP